MANWCNDVPAPMDADGEIVPLGVKKLYASDGEALDVELIGFDGRWVVKFDRRGLFNLNWFHLYEPDSWERLEEDIFTLAASKHLADPKGDAKECIERAKALAVRGDVE